MSKELICIFTIKNFFILALIAGTFIISMHAFLIAKVETPATFEMLGMSIRYSGAEGYDSIFFGVKLDFTSHNALLEDYDAIAAILITPTDQRAGESLSLWTAAASGVAATLPSCRAFIKVNDKVKKIVFLLSCV